MTSPENKMVRPPRTTMAGDTETHGYKPKPAAPTGTNVPPPAAPAGGGGGSPKK